MATESELLAYFKQIAARNDWTIDDFKSSRKETQEYLDEIWFLLKSIGHINVCTDQALSLAQTRLNQAITKINNEINRRLL